MTDGGCGGTEGDVPYRDSSMEEVPSIVTACVPG